jgi:hypothetical protein
MPHPKGGYHTADKKRVPGVTTVIKHIDGDPGGLMHWAWELGKRGLDYRTERDKAAGTGSLTHELIDADLCMRPPELLSADEMGRTKEEYETMLEQAHTGFEAYKEWRASTSLEIISGEESMVSEEHRYGGTPDAATVNGKACLIDWKTSNKLHVAYIAQLAGYRHLYQEVKGIWLPSAILLRVGKDYGDFHVTFWPEAVLDLGWTAFLGCLELHNLNKELAKLI